MPNSASASAAACITGQSESDPMTIPTCALMSLAFVAEVAGEPRGGVPRPLEAVLEVLAVGVDVTDLPAGPQVLAVEMDPQVRVAGQGVREAVVEPAGVRVGPAQDVDHHGPALARRRRPE